jgi:hypothetical protein
MSSKLSGYDISEMLLYAGGIIAYVTLIIVPEQISKRCFGVNIMRLKLFNKRR